ncbi:MAG: hypothetical protein B5M51_08165 [Anaerolinea sp. 4484_236]|nr:MAG: hypothetical protein B5M51_08165 [Anaerolinea sp. 4484_236]
MSLPLAKHPRGDKGKVRMGVESETTPENIREPYFVIFAQIKNKVIIHSPPPLTPPRTGGELIPPPFWGRLGGGG